MRTSDPEASVRLEVHHSLAILLPQLVGVGAGVGIDVAVEGVKHASQHHLSQVRAKFSRNGEVLDEEIGHVDVHLGLLARLGLGGEVQESGLVLFAEVGEDGLVSILASEHAGGEVAVDGHGDLALKKFRAIISTRVDDDGVLVVTSDRCRHTPVLWNDDDGHG